MIGQNMDGNMNKKAFEAEQQQWGGKRGREREREREREKKGGRWSERNEV